MSKDNEEIIDEEPILELPEEEVKKYKENIRLWESISYVPKAARSQITGGRLNGMTSIKPQWRYEELTKKFGPCGIGWSYEIEKEWLQSGAKGEFVQFVQIGLYVRHNGEWSRKIPGVGGSKLVVQESKGAHTNDEALKMAVTDALGNAGAKLGLGGKVYMGYPDERFSVQTTTSIEDLPKYIRKLQNKAGIPDELFLETCEKYNWDQDYIVAALENKIKDEGK